VTLPLVVPPVMGMMLRDPYFALLMEYDPPRVTFSVNTSAPWLPVVVLHSHG
jgi:hypothetical protein